VPPTLGWACHPRSPAATAAVRGRLMHGTPRDAPRQNSTAGARMSSWRRRAREVQEPAASPTAINPLPTSGSRSSLIISLSARRMRAGVRMHLGEDFGRVRGIGQWVDTLLLRQTAGVPLVEVDTDPSETSAWSARTGVVRATRSARSSIYERHGAKRNVVAVVEVRGARRVRAEGGRRDARSLSATRPARE
jgi:hypothetical protein